MDDIDLYLRDGCGRCGFYQTPQCKVNTWREQLVALRKIVLTTGLNETLKWKQPCYTFENKNVLIVAAFKDYAFVSFFKGSLLSDPKKLLIAPGENSQAARLFKFTKVSEIKKLEKTLKQYIAEAIELEKKGARVAFKKTPEAPPPELLEQFKTNPRLQKAFQNLTPGRQRGYILYFQAAKQSQTKTARIVKCTPKILAGIGLNDR